MNPFGETFRNSLTDGQFVIRKNMKFPQATIYQFEKQRYLIEDNIATIWGISTVPDPIIFSIRNCL